MSSNPAAMLQQYGMKAVLDSLEKAVGQSAAALSDDDTYRRLVVDAAWEMMPVPIRLMGRERLGWDNLFDELRREAFDTGGARVGLRSDAAVRLLALIGKVGGGPAQPALAPEVGSTRKLFDRSETAATAPKETRVQPAEPARISSPPPAAAGELVSRPPAPAPEPPVAEAVIGIDLGTTYSVVAHVDSQGRPWSIPNGVGDILTPSVVLFDDSGPIVGKEAVMASVMEPDKVAEVVKRDMGAKAHRKKIRGEYLPPEVISSFILKSVKTDAERKLGPLRKAVITVPAYFDESRRRATMDAGRLAGLEVMDIINEPTAAAIAYGYQIGFLDRYGRTKGDDCLRVLAYDLGGGTFDVSIVEIRGSSFKTIATDGDVYLGGKDWDEQIINLAAERFKKQYRDDPRGNPGTMQDLWNNAEIAKKTLTERKQATLYVNHAGARHKIDITRDEFEQATGFLLARTKTTTEIVVRQAGLNWDAIDKVLLVGGSTRMPMVVRMLTDVTGKTPDRSVSPDEAVAHGAALYADLLLHKSVEGASVAPKFTVTNVNSHSLGIVGLDPKTGQRRNQILIKKNTPLPYGFTGIFKTSKPNQRSVRLTVVEGESPKPDACTTVGACVIDNLPRTCPPDRQSK
jgi:molecular chaperone DnaK